MLERKHYKPRLARYAAKKTKMSFSFTQ